MSDTDVVVRKVRRQGTSIVVALAPELLDDVGIEEGDHVACQSDPDDNAIRIVKLDIPTPDD